MALVTLPYTATAGDVYTAARHNNNWNALLAQFNGNIEEVNLADLSISTAKLQTGSVNGVKIAMGSDAQGDILFHGAANYERLGAGTAGKFLTTKGAGANPEWEYGNIVQIVNTETGAVATGSTSIADDDTIPSITEGDEYMTLAITPKASTNKLLIEVIANATNNGNGNMLTMALFKDSDTDALAAVQNDNVNSGRQRQLILTHYMTAGATSSITFRIRIGGESTQTVTFNGSGGNRKLGGVLASSINITEIKV